MRLRICCCYCTDEGPTCTATESSNGTTLPRIVAEQPKLSQSVQLDKITEVSNEESAVQSKEETPQETVPSKEEAPQKTVPSKEEAPKETICDKGSNDATAVVDVQDTSIKPTTSTQIVPLQTEAACTTPNVATSDDKGEEEQQNDEHDGVTDATTEQNKSRVSFTVIAPGHFKSVYKGTEFYILNGELQKINGACDESDKEFIMANYASAMVGVKQAMLGIEQGLLGMQRTATQLNQPNLHSILAAVHKPPPQPPTQPRANQQDLEKFLERWINETRKNEANKALDTSHSVDELGGYIIEPPLEKTTFNPKEVVYEDPKKYEKLDSFEVPDAKRLDEYIISRDEQLASGNAYYFHAAQPRRVRRRTLGRKERLQLASPDRYSLFESECLKLHNKFRSMHGIPPLVNNTFLCKVAREWAEHLALNDAFYHRPNNDYGENLYSGDRLHMCARRPVTAWYDEIHLYDYNNPKFDKATGHFTQLIWKDTREMGTGVAQIRDKVWVCCNYHPRGNYVDKFNDEYVPRPVVVTKKA